MDTVVFAFIALLIVSILFLLPVLIGYKLWRKGKYTKYIVVVLLAGYAYMWFRAFYPEDAFFADHLERFTGVEFEEGMDVVEKSAGYPDIHGDYPACAVIKLSEKNIARLTSAKVDGYKEIEPSRASGVCLKSVDLKLEHLYFKDSPGELIYWGYNSKSFEAYFDYYSY